MSSFKWIFLEEIVLNTEFSILNYKDSLNFMNHTTVVWGDNKTTNPLKKWTKNSAVVNFFILSPALETVIGSLTKFQSWHLKKIRSFLWPLLFQATVLFFCQFSPLLKPIGTLLKDTLTCLLVNYSKDIQFWTCASTLPVHSVGDSSYWCFIK